MRTRFLNIDYFNSAPVHALDFLRLPLPYLPPSNLSIYDHHRCFDHLSILTISLEIHQLPIGNALSTFFSHVIPDVIEDIRCSHGKVGFHGQRNLDSERIVDLRTSEDEKGIIPDDKGNNDLEVVQFEMPELDLSLENAYLLEKENMHIFSEVSDAESSVDMPITKLKWQNMAEILDSVFSVDNISPVCNMDLKPDMLEYDGSIQGSFPLLEVDETSLEICNDIPGWAEFIITETWGPLDEVMDDCKELLPTMKMDMLDYLSDHCLSNQFLKSDGSDSILNLVTDLVDIIEYSQIEYSIRAFEEFQYYDVNSHHFSDALSNLETYSEEKKCENMFGEDAKRFKVFNELIVSHELILVDDCFRSLPIPVISDRDILLSVNSVVEEILNELKPLCSSVSDGIYLDWHLLEEDNLKNGKYSFSSKFFEELETYTVDFSLDNGMLVFDFIFSDYSSEGLTIDEENEMLNIPNDGFSTDINYEKPQVNDFDFFLNHVESNTRKNHDSVAKALNTTSSTTLITLHRVKLSDNILVLIDKLRKCYLAIMENYRELIKVDDFSLLMLTKKELLEIIKKSTAQRPSFSDGDSLAYLKLSTIKHVAWYLCYYGIYTTYLYIDNLCQSQQFLKFRLSFLYDLIQDFHEKAKNEVFESHPSLCVIDKILQSIISQRSSKLLIVAEKVFWFQLKRLFISRKVSHTTPHNFHDSDFTDVLLQSDCCLVSHEHISPSFPFDKFDIILEYGGACESSRVSTVSANLVGFPQLHFVKVEIDSSSFPRALCEGVNMPTHIGCTRKGDPHSIPLLHESNLDELLAFMPTENYKESDQAKSFSTESNENHKSMPSVTDSVIIVNTKNFDREMIISRRSTYQRILAFEKQGTQVVERDLNLPVDIIISAAVCLVWYDCQNIGKKATAQNEASSCLPLCVENIAANILTSVSFAFSSCILVFEGESGFLAGIMESSDELYAAAATLGINLQLFCSYSSDTTDEIILSCLRHTIQINRGLYPKVPESEILAESFLTLFPSINPLLAHAILSSGSILDFFECSKEDRIRALQKYQVHGESITLLSAFLRFGEREDSKSGMTDCSSSVSSAPESEYSHFKGESEQRKRKHNEGQHDINIHMDDLFHFQPLDLFTDGRNTPTRISQPVIIDVNNSANVRTNPARESHPNLTWNNGLFREKNGMGMMKKSDDHDFVGDVIDLENYPMGEQFFVSDSAGFFPLERNTKKDPALEVSRTTRKLSFPTSAEIMSDSDAWISKEGFNHDSDTFSNNTPPLKYQKRSSFSDNTTVQKGTSHYGGTPLSQAIREAQPQNASPWTIGFLNRVREKSKLRQQSLPHDLSAPCFGYMGNNISKFAAKRKSPSILDFYKYQGGSTPKKIIDRKKLKGSGQPSSSSKKDKTSLSFLPTSTPNDKRARRKLSFATNGSTGQSKLVWSNENSYIQNNHF